MTEPNQTLYLRNLNDKINKEELRRLIYQLFSTFGLIKEINLSKSFKMRGQAFVVFDSLACAEEAMSVLQGFTLLGKPVCIQYARAISDCVSRGLDIHTKQARHIKRMRERIESVKRENALQRAGIGTLEVINFPENMDLDELRLLFKDDNGFIRAYSIDSRVFLEFEGVKNAEHGLKRRDTVLGNDYSLDLLLLNNS